MVEKWLNKHLWSKMEPYDAWWCKGFTVSTVMWWIIYTWWYYIVGGSW